jgi:hypothetical protein
MLLESIAITANKITALIEQEGEKLNSFIETHFSNSHLYTSLIDNNSINIFSDGNRRKPTYELKPILHIPYSFTLSENKKKSAISFFIECGYLCNEEENVIYFGIGEESENILSTEFINELEQSIPNKWKISKDEYYIGIEFIPDNSFSEEKINDYTEDFKNYILTPILSRLE